MIPLTEALLLNRRGVVSIVGAGGKTSLMFRLARDLSASGATVLTTTTTKILKPSKDQSPHVILAPLPKRVIAQAHSALRRYRHVTAAAAQRPSAPGKLAGFQPQVIDELHHAGIFDWILVEADGAAGRSLKAPALHEPVIPASTGWVIGLAGMKAVGKPLTDKWVFRTNLFMELTGLRIGQAVSEASVAMVLSDGAGVMKGCPSTAKRIAFLNMADQRRRLTIARRIAWLLQNRFHGSGLQRVVIGKILHAQPVLEYYDL
jgi:probable selenium-dependent hydroxylase accessory protein YqeC